MFWRGNFIAVNDVNFLLKEENVSLSQVLESDDILPECRADNKALRQYLTKPEIRAELITLITEEPSKNLELTTQYRHAHIASEVLTSQLATLRDQLAMDTVQMNRLCDFVNKPPPLNPLLASYFSKTIEMLFQRNPKQDWYAHHIVCLHVLDLFKSRRDFLPNLLRHISTSAICDVFKCLFSLPDPFNKIIMEWLDENQVHDNLIHIICGTYEPEPLPPATPPAPPAHLQGPAAPPAQDAGLDNNHNDSQSNGEADAGNQNTSQQPNSAESGSESGGDGGGAEPAGAADTREARMREVASANAAALLCEVALENCGVNAWGAGEAGGAGAALAARLREDSGVRALLQAAFTAPPHAARAALLHAATLLRALLVLPDDAGTGCACGPAVCDEGPCAVEHAVAPHVPLLHNALLRPPGACTGVGAARVAVAAVLARLAKAEGDDVFRVLLSLGTAQVLVDMVFAYPENNFLHAQVLDFVHNALANRVHGDRYAAHLVEECNILTRLMDAFEENEDKFFATSARRAGYMGHVVALLRALDLACVGDGRGDAGAAGARWERFCAARLHPHLQRLDTPLGGVHPSDTHYEMEDSPEMPCGSYDLGEGVEEAAEALEGEPAGAAPRPERMQNEMEFLRLSDHRFDDMWGDTADADADAEAEADGDAVQQVLADVSPWECAAGGGADDGGWARFPDPFNSDWLETLKEQTLTMELAQKMLVAFNCDGSEKPKPNLHYRSETLKEETLTMELAQKMLVAFNCDGSEKPKPTLDPTLDYAALHFPPLDDEAENLDKAPNATTASEAVTSASEPPASQSLTSERPASVIPDPEPPAAETFAPEPPAAETSAPEPTPAPSAPEPPAAAPPADDAER